MLAGTAVVAFLPYAWSGILATAVLWVGMLVPESCGRSAGLARSGCCDSGRLDLLFGLGLGLLLRIVQGWLELAAGASGALPSYPMIGGRLPSGFVFTEVLSAGRRSPR